MTSIDRFHSSYNTLNENAAYQLGSGRMCQMRRYTFYEEFECCTVSLQYMLILNLATVTAHFDLGLLQNDAHKRSKSNSCEIVNLLQAFAAI